MNWLKKTNTQVLPPEIKLEDSSECLVESASHDVSKILSWLEIKWHLDRLFAVQNYWDAMNLFKDNKEVLDAILEKAKQDLSIWDYYIIKHYYIHMVKDIAEWNQEAG